MEQSFKLKKEKFKVAYWMCTSYFDSFVPHHITSHGFSG